MIGESLSRTCHAWPAMGYHCINSHRVQNVYPSTPNTYYPRGPLGLKDRQQSIRLILLLLQYITYGYLLPKVLCTYYIPHES